MSEINNTKVDDDPSTLEIKDYNVVIDGGNVFDQLRMHDNILIN